ncbi:hypothetical protein [Burkholderia sp. PU8-34]
MRVRGWMKVVLVTIAINELLTFAFAYVAEQVGSDLTMLETLVFSSMTCALVSYWLLIDARNAWRHAVEKGCIGSQCAADDEDLPKIADTCPRRWLVVLHIELNPDLVRTV